MSQILEWAFLLSLKIYIILSHYIFSSASVCASPHNSKHTPLLLQWAAPQKNLASYDSSWAAPYLQNAVLYHLARASGQIVFEMNDMREKIWTFGLKICFLDAGGLRENALIERKEGEFIIQT